MPIGIPMHCLMDRRTDRSALRVAWSQLKIIDTFGGVYKKLFWASILCIVLYHVGQISATERKKKQCMMYPVIGWEFAHMIMTKYVEKIN